MADNSKIEWTDATWNVITGCSVISPGCANCYAMRLAGTRLQHIPSRQGLTKPSAGGPVWTGEVRFNGEWLHQPLLWKRPRKIFVCAHGDLFHPAVPDSWIDRVFAVMALAPQHTLMVLTKRADRMKAYMLERWQPSKAQNFAGIDIPAEPAGSGESREDQVRRECEPLLERFGLADTTKDHLWTENGDCKAMKWEWPLPNVWMGVSAEDQRRADERVPDMLATPAAVRWVSAEPLLGPIDFRRYIGRVIQAVDSSEPELLTPAVRLNWIVAGGESGPGWRPMAAEWAESIRDQCRDARVAFFMKQMAGKKAIPHDLLIRQWPGQSI